MAYPQVSFEVQDALLTVTRLLPGQNATVVSPAIDLGIVNQIGRAHV